MPHRSRFTSLILIVIVTITAIPALEASGTERSIQAARLEATPTIDGAVVDAEWAGAEIVQGFVQIEPEYGEPSPFTTEVRIGYTDTAVFVAFRCFDPDPDRIAASITARDRELDADDSVTVLLDTFHDRRTAYYFSTNLSNAQADGRVADNGRVIDGKWDATWTCAAQKTGDGWSAEFAIPFASLKFGGKAGQSWGVNFQRQIPRRLEVSQWSGPAESRWRVAQFGILTGLDVASRELKRYEVIPYALGMVDRGGNTDFRAGVDFRYRITSDLGADLTLNPDFALVEADVEEINLTRYELYLPEKRPFFLEGVEMFDQRYRQFYSRRIGDISWGGKVAGKVGDWDLSALAADGKGTGSDWQGDSAKYSVLRMKRGFGKGSNIGLLAANRSLMNENTGSVGLDTTLFFTETLGFTGQLFRVHGPENDGAIAWFVRPAYDSANFHVHVRLTSIDPGILENFNTVGFLNEDDRREVDANVTKTIWVQKGSVEKNRTRVNYNRYYGHDGTLRSWKLDAQSDFDLRNLWVVRIDYRDEFKLFEREFRNKLFKTDVGWDDRAGRSFFAGYGVGTNFDSDIQLLEVEANVQISDAWAVEYSFKRLELTPDPELKTTSIHVLRTSYYFNPDLFVKLLVQTNSAVDKNNVQALVVWRILPPFGALQVAYQRGNSELGEESDQDDTLFAKISWIF